MNDVASVFVGFGRMIWTVEAKIVRKNVVAFCTILPHMAKMSEGSKTVVPDIGGLEWDHVYRRILQAPSSTLGALRRKSSFTFGNLH